jgi:hypothetical protein
MIYNINKYVLLIVVLLFSFNLYGQRIRVETCPEGYYLINGECLLPELGKTCDTNKHWEKEISRGIAELTYTWVCTSNERPANITCEEFNPKPEKAVWINYTEEPKEVYIKGSWSFNSNQCKWECLMGCDANCIPIEGAACENDDSEYYAECGSDSEPHHWEYLSYEGYEGWACYSDSKKLLGTINEICINIYKPKYAYWSNIIGSCDTYENGEWISHPVTDCDWSCIHNFKNVDNNCVPKTIYEDSEFCLGDSNYTASCNQSNVGDLKNCLSHKKTAHINCEDKIIERNDTLQEDINNKNQQIITWSNQEIEASQSYFTEEQNLIKEREDAIKEREDLLLVKKKQITEIKKISNKYISDLKLEKTNLKNIYDSFKTYKDKWNIVEQDFKDLATLVANETDRSQLTIYLFDVSGKMNVDFSEGDNIYRDAIRLRDNLLKIQKEYDREINPYNIIMGTYNLKILDETEIPTDFLRRMTVYINQRKSLVKRTGEKMILDIDTKIKTLIVSQASAEAQALYIEASNNMSIASFIELVGKKISKTNVANEESTSTIYSYNYSQYRNFKEFLEFKVFCNNIDNEQMSYRTAGCNIYNNKAQAIEFYLADTMPFLIDDALYDLQGYANELQLDYITKAWDALANDDLGSAAYYYDRVLRVEDAK